MTTESYKDIFEAAKTGTVDDIRYFVEQKRVDVNTKDGKGLTLLHYVAGHNPNVEVAKYLVEQGADVRAKDNNGHNPLYVSWQSAPSEEVGIYFLDIALGSKGREVTDPVELAEIKRRMGGNSSE